jgi:hypothetical protein
MMNVSTFVCQLPIANGSPSTPFHPLATSSKTVRLWMKPAFRVSAAQTNVEEKQVTAIFKVYRFEDFFIYAKTF